MTTPSDRELLSKTAALKLLERAGEIDSESHSVETLRAAAREAGISEVAFEAALVEMRGKMAVPPALEPPRKGRRVAASLVMGALLLGAMTFIVIPRTIGPAQPPMVFLEKRIECLPMKTAQRVADDLLQLAGNEVQVLPGTRTLRVRGTPDQLQALEASLSDAVKGITTCDNTPAR